MPEPTTERKAPRWRSILTRGKLNMTVTPIKPEPAPLPEGVVARGYLWTRFHPVALTGTLWRDTIAGMHGEEPVELHRCDPSDPAVRIYSPLVGDGPMLGMLGVHPWYGGIPVRVVVVERAEGVA